MSNFLDFLPKCWSDDERMASLFSSFRNKDVNPIDWDSKMMFWTDLIIESCKQTNQLIFDYKLLMERFQRKGTQPLGLKTVLGEMLIEGKIKNVAELQTELQQESWARWGIKVFIQKPIVWVVDSILNIQEKQLEEGRFVVVDLLKDYATRMKNEVEENAKFSSTDYIVEYKTLKSHYREFTDETFDLILHYMRREKVITIMEMSDKSKIVKFSKKGEKSRPIINDVDIGIINLKNTDVILEKQIEACNENIAKCLAETRLNLRQGSKLAAKNALRKKCSYEKQIEKHEAARNTIESLLHNIQVAESDKMVLDAYQTGVKAFKESLSQNDISVSKVDDVMIAVQETLDMQDDIQEAMKIPQEPDDDLEDELTELLKGDPVDTSEMTNLSVELEKVGMKGSETLVFPQVPKHVIGSPSTSDRIGQPLPLL